jgi:hypothetical protein
MTKFYRISNAEGKTWMMPARNMRVAMELYQPSGRNGKLLKRWFPWLHTLVPVRKALRVETVWYDLSEEMREGLETVFGTKDLECAVFFGTPCVHQKMTIQLSKGKRILGYCKVTGHEEVSDLFRREKRTLDTLQWMGVTDIPRCLYCGLSGEEGKMMFVQSTVKTLQSKAVRQWGKLQAEFVERMTQCTLRKLPFEETDYYRTLRELRGHLNWLPEGMDRTRTAKLCDRLLAKWQGQMVEFAACHGDFTPWNMLVEKGRLFVFDWEYARLTVPPRLDRYHFFTQTALFERHWRVEDFTRYLQSAQGNWVDREAYTCYLVDIIARYVLRAKGRVEPNVVSALRLYESLLVWLEEVCLSRHLVAFHLYNDYSGSPKVLFPILQKLALKGTRVDVVTSGHGGALDGLEGMKGVRIHRYRYAFSDRAWLTMWRYAAVQVITFCWALRWIFDRNVVFYINTILPVGPALAGRLTGKKVVYHYHENAFAKGRVYRWLARAMELLAHEIICVSSYQASFLNRKKHVTVVPNAVSREFVSQLRPNAKDAFERKTVLMLSSLKEYKGTRQFIRIAQEMPQYRFVLVINDTQEHIDDYLKTQDMNEV